MSIDYDKIIENLHPFRDHVFYYGLSETELTYLEQSIQQKFPDYYRNFLKLFGVRQDWVFGLLSRESDFVRARHNLAKLKASFGGYKLIDYGILCLKDDVDA